MLPFCAKHVRAEQEVGMRTGLLLASLVIVVAAPATAQGPDTGVRTETMERMATTRSEHLPFNILGLMGLLGLLGLRRSHPEDSYHPSPME